MISKVRINEVDIGLRFSVLFVHCFCVVGSRCFINIMQRRGLGLGRLLGFIFRNAADESVGDEVFLDLPNPMQIQWEGKYQIKSSQIQMQSRCERVDKEDGDDDEETGPLTSRSLSLTRLLSYQIDRE